VDRERVQDAYRAYAYFRWVDDQLDTNSSPQQEKSALIDRQQALLEACYTGEFPIVSSLEEQMLVDLVGNDKEKDSGLQFYLRNMMDLMVFDVTRRGRVISQEELSEYSHLLSTAVTEALFYFIGHQNHPTCNKTRYQAVYGAHVVHMLRDLVHDIDLGYINIPAEVFETNHIPLDDLHSPAMRNWVYERVKLARQYFWVGIRYIAMVKNLRCRLAGFTYVARFEWVLKAIEKDDYCLRPEYSERKSLRAGLWMLWRVFTSLLNMSWISEKSSRQVVLSDWCFG
jgi:phytoene/squalene synthetase